MKEIRNDILKESLDKYTELVDSLKGTTKGAVRDLLGESVQNEYNKILAEAETDEDEYDVEEVDDTESDETTTDTEDTDDTTDDSTEEVDTEETDTDDSAEDDIDGADESDDSLEDVDTSMEVDDTTDDDSNDEEWAEFDKYKISDDEYDFSEADDAELVKVYKLLKDDDHVLVNVDQDSKKVELKDNDTGSEYIIDLGQMSGNETNFDNDDDTEFDDDDLTNESRIFEVALNEYDSNTGYTDSYQKKDVMTTPSMKEPGKKVNDWDKGVPTSKNRPWGHKKVKAEPFSVNEEEDIEMDEGTNVGGFVQQNSTSKSHIPNSNGRKARNSSVAGVKTKSTSTPRYAQATNEAKIAKIMKKANTILRENEELKSVLVKFKTVLQEAAVTNVNLGQIIKLIMENSTTKAEKQEIVARFGKEAKTVEQSNQLYESISRELKKNNTINIDEGKQFTTNSSKTINETRIYKSQDMISSLDLMHRICK